jgi:hypothetical protein
MTSVSQSRGDVKFTPETNSIFIKCPTADEICITFLLPKVSTLSRAVELQDVQPLDSELGKNTILALHFFVSGFGMHIYVLDRLDLLHYADTILRAVSMSASDQSLVQFVNYALLVLSRRLASPASI